MKILWEYIDRKDWNLDTKYRFIFFIFAIIAGLIGFVAWLIVRNWALSSLEWMFCFIGYPVIISFPIVFIYISNKKDL